MSGTVLCVDPDDEARSATASTLEDAGLTVTTCPDLATAVDRLDGTIDCVVSEFELPDGSGLDLLTVLRERVPDASFVLFTEADRTTSTVRRPTAPSSSTSRSGTPAPGHVSPNWSTTAWRSGPRPPIRSPTTNATASRPSRPTGRFSPT
jgi:CheY-like chemotaxis protein